jgi:predicted nucleotidyltransferase
VKDILGMPELDERYLPPEVVVALKERAERIRGLGALILFGSVARGEASRKSDIDLLMVPLDGSVSNDVKKELLKLLHGLEDEFRLKINFSLLVYDGTEDQFFLWETLKDGDVVFSRPEMVLPSVSNPKPHALISYRLNGQNNTEKKRIQRFLYESKNGMAIDMNNKMEYVAPGVIVVDLERSKRIVEYFDDIGLDYSLMKIWR